MTGASRARPGDRPCIPYVGRTAHTHTHTHTHARAHAHTHTGWGQDRHRGCEIDGCGGQCAGSGWEVLLDYLIVNQEVGEEGDCWVREGSERDRERARERAREREYGGESECVCERESAQDIMEGMLFQSQCCYKCSGCGVSHGVGNKPRI